MSVFQHTIANSYQMGGSPKLFGLKLDKDHCNFWTYFLTDFGGPQMPLGRHLDPGEAVLAGDYKNRYETHAPSFQLRSS